MGGAKMNDPFTPSLTDFILETMDEWHLAGLSIAVVDGDDTFTKSFGHATLPDTPATPDTLWYGGSTTKAFTTAALAHLIESGKYPALSNGWQTPVSSIIRDDFVTGDEWATNNLSLEDLACHRSGLTNNDVSIRLEENGKPWTIRDIVRNIRYFPLRAQPRTEFDYNNEGYAVLSYVIEKVTGKWLGDVLKEIIWEPLEMNSTFLDLQQAKDAPEHLSTGYYWDENNKRHQGVPFLPTGIISGAGAVISNVIDYTKWIRCLLRKEPPLSSKVHQDIRRPRFIHNPEPAGGLDVSLYGLSWWRTSIEGTTVYWHSGSTTSHGALVYWLPDLDYGVVMLANYPSPAREIIMRRVVYDKLRTPSKRRHDIARDLRDAQLKRQKDVENAADILFPNRPSKPLPPSLDIRRLSGTYHAPGYGSWEFVEVVNKRAPMGVVLVADRRDLLWKTRMTLRHVSGDFWVAFIALLEGDGLPEAFFAAVFRMGVDGEPSGLELTFKDRERANEGRVLFQRVK
ncbi:hypothetical protein NM208_g8602 [Fusarium decemcellulare]|uniref:Uncharacterized protein n=1 Tax=Fusarium decemcellulare TaxID=57161 RepID=A0ACC1S4U0_9HYPO|nr:hypothetical protein NM208_g8602 [Fusarium decemcellulare]